LRSKKPNFQRMRVMMVTRRSPATMAVTMIQMGTPDRPVSPEKTWSLLCNYHQRCKCRTRMLVTAM
jgi:hypothetical protein